MNRFFSTCTALILIGVGFVACPAWAQTPGAPKSSLDGGGSSAKDAHVIVQTIWVQKVCKAPLDLKVQNAAMEDVASGIQKKLSLSNDTFVKKLPILVRGVRPVRLTFDIKNSTVGSLLNSSATIAGAKLWAFSDHLLIAPDEALTPEEKEQNLQGLASTWQLLGSFHGLWSEGKKTEKMSQFVTNELNVAVPTRSPLSSNNADNPFAKDANSLLGHMDFNQLSPDAQAMLQDLVDASRESFQARGDRLFGDPTFDLSGATIGVNPKNNALTAFFSDGAQLFWNGPGNGFSASPPKSPTAPSKPFIDPSAGKS